MAEAQQLTREVRQALAQRHANESDHHEIANANFARTSPAAMAKTGGKG